MPKKKIHSRRKGANGELEAAHYFSAKGFPARRGQQFSGLGDSPDIVVDNLSQYWFEVKRTEKGNPYNWIDQAVRDAKGNKTPVVLHRRSGQPWICLILIDDFLHLMQHVKMNQPVTVLK